MRKTLNYLTLLYGSFFILTGLLKLSGTLKTFKLSLGESYLTIPLYDSMFYIVSVNFLGGVAFCYHAIGTLKFSKNKTSSGNALDSDISLEETPVKPLSTVASLISYYVVLVSFFILIESFVLLGSFDGLVTQYFTLFLMSVFYSLPQALVPGVLGIRNIIFNNEVESKSKRRRKVVS